MDSDVDQHTDTTDHDDGVPRYVSNNFLLRCQLEEEGNDREDYRNQPDINTGVDIRDNLTIWQDNIQDGEDQNENDHANNEGHCLFLLLVHLRSFSLVQR